MPSRHGHRPQSGHHPDESAKVSRRPDKRKADDTLSTSGSDTCCCLECSPEELGNDPVSDQSIRTTTQHCIKDEQARAWRISRFHHHANDTTINPYDHPLPEEIRYDTPGYGSAATATPDRLSLSPESSNATPLERFAQPSDWFERRLMREADIDDGVMAHADLRMMLTKDHVRRMRSCAKEHSCNRTQKAGIEVRRNSDDQGRPKRSRHPAAHKEARRRADGQA